VRDLVRMALMFLAVAIAWRLLRIVGVQVEGISIVEAALALAVGAGLVMVGACIGAWFRRPGRGGVARDADRAGGFHDEVAAAWDCVENDAVGPVAGALVRRAILRLRDDVDAAKLYPMRRLRRAWILLPALALILLLAPPPGGSDLLAGPRGGGVVPGGPEVVARADGGKPIAAPDTPKVEVEPDAPSPADDPPKDPDPDPEVEDTPEPEPTPDRALQLELFPEQLANPAEGPIPLTGRITTVDPDGPAANGSLEVKIDDGPWIPLPGSLRIDEGRSFDRLRAFDLLDSVEEGRLSGGVHLVRLAFRPEGSAEDDGRRTESEPLEIFVTPEPGEGGGGGGSGESEDDSENEPTEGGEDGEPSPDAAAPEQPDDGAPETGPDDEPDDPPPPPPPSKHRREFVRPLFDENAPTVKKEGAGLVFDPSAPKGKPPPPRTLKELFPELQRRAESAISRDEVPPDAREMVRRYFELIRPK